MPCYRPIGAYKTQTGEILFAERGNILNNIDLPCGRCVGCRLERSRQWAVRMMHERQMHSDACFVTLTYNDNNLPKHGTLNHEDFQKFIKRLRQWAHRNKQPPIRYYMCGEYGEQKNRPHYHAAIFGLAFRHDSYPWKKGEGGFMTFRSPTLEKLWTLGDSNIGELTFESAGYIARYIMKKITGDLAKTHYTVIDPDTGEITSIQPEYCKMSLKPGIGATWLQKFQSDVYPNDRVITKGVETKPPKYYDKLLKRTQPELLETLKMNREIKQREKGGVDNRNERLKVREEVTNARIRELKRN